MTTVKNLMCAGLVCGLGLNAGADSLEQFDYSAGALAGQNGGTGWASAWTDVVSNSGGDFTVGASGLDHPNLSGETGNAAFSPSTGSRYIRTLDQAYSSGTVYLSFLMQMSNPNDPGIPFSALELNSGGNGDGFRVLALGALRGNDDPPSVQDNDGYALEIQDGPGTTTLSTDPLSPGFSTDVNLFVLAFDLDNDTLETFVNPDASTDLAGAGDVSTALFSGFSFDRVGFANFIGSNATTIDEIRVDTTAPTLVPEPGSLALLGLGGLAVLRRRRG